MKIAMLSPIACRTPILHYCHLENIVSLLTEGLVRRGLDITLFATQDSETRGKIIGVCPKGYLEDKDLPSGVWECLNISGLFERGDEFDLIHNHFGLLPLTYMNMTTTPLLTTIHGFSFPEIFPVYKKYNSRSYYVAISEADKHPELNYISTVYHGVDPDRFIFQPVPGDYLLLFGPVHHGNGIRECIDIAKENGMKLIIAGAVQDAPYFERHVKPCLDGERTVYAGSAGHEERNRLFGGAYALLHPLNFHEPFNLSVVEAMACGTPVIAVNRGSMPEVIVPGKTGYLVSDVEEMAAMITRIKEIDRGDCRRCVEEKFTVDHMVEGYIRVYERILGLEKREDHRPWGFYEVLSDLHDHKVKRITVYPGKRLSYQRHRQRSEHWYMVAGNALVTLDGREITLSEGESIDIPRGGAHRISNRADRNIVFIEVQQGSYFGEDDIERLEDDYGRS